MSSSKRRRLVTDRGRVTLTEPTLVARELSRILKPSIGSKAASVVGGCEAPEVLVTVGRYLGLLSVERHLHPDLEQRILDTYVHGTPPGPKSWIQASDQSDIAELVVEIHSERSVPAQQTPPWQERYLHEENGRFVAPICECGSADLAYIAAPEPDGLVCMACREDRSGLAFPESWNAALIHASYWANLGYSTDPARIPVKPTHFVDALRVR